ncbi:MAG: TetR/AcrR family transcriptional regulator [Christensenellales bacterium]|jgi:possible transcriptional regulator
MNTTETSADYTKRYIVEALFKLMEKKDFRDITITELTARAGVGRATFYRNFSDKESVLIYFFNRTKTDFSADKRFIPRCDRDFYEVILSVLSELKRNLSAVTLLRKSRLEYLYLDYLNASFAADFENSAKPQNPYLPYGYSGALYNISMKWVDGGCASPAEEVAEALFYICFNRHIK